MRNIASAACVLLLSLAPGAHATRLTPADFGAAVLSGSPQCGGLRPEPMHVAASTRRHPTCCTGRMSCSEFLATTRIGRTHSLPHT